MCGVRTRMIVHFLALLGPSVIHGPWHPPPTASSSPVQFHQARSQPPLVKVPCEDVQIIPKYPKHMRQQHPARLHRSATTTMPLTLMATEATMGTTSTSAPHTTITPNQMFAMPLGGVKLRPLARGVKHLPAINKL